MRASRGLLATTLALCAGLVSPAVSNAQDSGTLHSLLNQQRAANGIPPVETYNAADSDGCFKHISYQQQNGGGLTHEEVPGRPGYTDEGAKAGASSVLAKGSEWTETSNPWTKYPLHLAGLFNPALNNAGGASSAGYECYSTFSGTRGFTSPAFFSAPGNGRIGVENSMDATGEGPFAPQELVGLTGVETGYQSVVWLEGYSNPTIASATTVGPSGPVETRHVDNQTPRAEGYLRNSGVVIPVKPLDAYASYRTTVIWQTDDGLTIPTSFAFETTGLENSIALSARNLSKGRLQVSVDTPADGVAASVSRAGGKPTSVALRPENGTYTAVLSKLAPGTYAICARSGGRGTAYGDKSTCKSATVKGWTSLALSKRLGKGRKAKLAVSRSAVGREAVLRVARYKTKCRSGHRCRDFVKVGRTRTTRIKLVRRSMRVKVPRAGKRGRVKVSVALKSFTKGKKRFTGSTARRTYR